MKTVLATSVLALLATEIAGYSLPSNVQTFYNRVKGTQGGSQCPDGKVLQSGFYSKDGGSNSKTLGQLDGFLSSH